MEGTRLKRIDTELKAIRELLDDAHKTPFGEMNRLLDRMTDHCDEAIRIADVALWHEHVEGDA